jgi:putative ABC transport system substrate-binding protein
VRRRSLLATLGRAAAAYPLASRAQQNALPVIGYLNAASAEGVYGRSHAAFLRGLAQAGYEDRRNVAIEYRWAEGHSDRLPDLAADLVRRKVNVIAATGTSTLVAAKAATSTIPIVFSMAGDPVELGFIDSLSRPGRNLTGATQLSVSLAPKRLELMHQLLPKATDFGLLYNPGALSSQTVAHELQPVASTIGVRLHALPAANDGELAEVFTGLPKEKIEALVIATDAFFNTRSAKLAALAFSQRLPAIYQYQEFTDAGGLMGLGGDIADSYRIAGVYAGRILKGEKAADLAVQQVTKVELILNLKTAKAFGLMIPPALLARADEVIE